MASILSVGNRLFRTRDASRDASTDRDRFMTVRRSLLAAIDGAQREREGLQTRLDVYYAQATNLIDNSGEFGNRSPEDEGAIEEAERNAAAARLRIGQISEHMEQLKTVLATLDATAPQA